jgi:hypothetical protein
MTNSIEVEEIGRNGRLAPTPEQLKAILLAIESTIATRPNEHTAKSPTSLWRFSGRGWGSHPAERRSRPQRNNAY